MTQATLPQLLPADLEPAPGAALGAYERCAEYYDLLTADYDHESWLEQILALAQHAGFAGGRVLDVACGTGKSSAPLVRRGYEVSACDLSPAMVRRARLRLGPAATVFVADMRRLPGRAEFELVTCMDDAVNYLLSREDLAAALASIKGALAPGGVAVFDVNTLATYRAAFAAGNTIETAGGRLRWRGGGRTAAGHWTAAVEPVPGSGQPGRRSVHLQRHHAQHEVHQACAAAGLEVLRVLGQTRGCKLHHSVDEDQHDKLLYVVRRPPRRCAQ
jgi:SAM-dependent methyltransferase